MRLGQYLCRLEKESFAYKPIGMSRYGNGIATATEFNSEYEKTLAAAGLVFAGKNPDYGLAEVVELRDHPWFLGCQFHPEFKSRPLRPHPLFSAFIGASHAHRRKTA